MKAGTFQAAKSLWVWIQARDAFWQVEKTTAYMLRNHVKKGHELFDPLVVSISVTYSKPFKRSNGVKSISPDIVPNEFQHVHALLIMQRDKHHAHKDGGEFKLETTFHQNQVRARVNGLDLQWGVNEFDLTEKGLEQVRNLAATLREKCLYWVRKYHNQIETDADLPSGDYVLNIHDASKDVLLPLK